MKIAEYNEMMAYLLRPATGGRVQLGVGGMPYTIFGKNIDIPEIPGVQSGAQNKKSVEAGFKNLEKWLENPTPENWVKTFGKNNAFNYQLRNYLQGTKDIGSVKGMDTAEKVFDAVNIKSLLKPNQIQKILDLDTGGKGVSLKSKRAKTFGNLKYTLDEQIKEVENFQNGEQWLKKNRSESEIRKYANAIRSMKNEAKKIGGFPFGDNSEKKLWSNLYRASYRGDRIQIVGEFAEGNLPINKDGKIDWKITNKAGTPAWKRVEFVDVQAPKNTSFTWGENFKKGDLKNQIDNTFGQGFFDKSTAAYDVQVRTGSKRDFTKTGGGKTIKSDLKIKLLRAEALAENPKATKKQIDEYIKRKSPRFNITDVHHPDGVGVNPYKTEPTFRYANRALDREVMQPLKAGTIDINEAKLRIDRINKNVGPIRVKLDDGYYGNYINTQKSIVQAAQKYPTRNLASIPGVTTADKISTPEKTKTRDMFEQANKRLSDGPELGANKGLLRGLGEALKTVPTPAGALALTAGFGVDPTSAIDRAGLGLEAAFAPELVKQSAKMGAAQRFFNLGLSPKLAARAARVASPLGIASLGLEGLYQYGKFAKDEIAKVRAMDDEERFAYNEGLMDEGGLLD